MALIKHWKKIFMHPITRGMLSYSALWPTGSIVQQTLAGNTWETYDWLKCLRFSAYGSLFVAPTLYVFVRFSTRLWPRQDLRTAIKKSLVQQVTYVPFATASFFFAMTYMETQNITMARKEVADKFPFTYKVGMLWWPIVSTISFSLVPERNRVVFISVCSLIWSTFLAYMKQLEIEETNKKAVADLLAAVNLKAS